VSRDPAPSRAPWVVHTLDLWGAALFILLLPPWQPIMPWVGLDPSWQLMLHHAFAEGWQAGSEFVYTFGPLGFLFTATYHPETYPLLLSFWVLLSALLGLVFVRCLADLSPWLAVLGVPLILSTLVSSRDLVFFALPLLLAEMQRRSMSKGLGLGLAIACGTLLLVKLSVVPLVLGAVVIADAIRWRRVRGAPVLTATAGASLTLLYGATGGDPAAFISFCAISLEVLGGFSEAMQVDGPAWAPISHHSHPCSSGRRSLSCEHVRVSCYCMAPSSRSSDFSASRPASSVTTATRWRHSAA
jgi:hypothetical protein